MANDYTAGVLREQERSNSANVIFRTALGEHDALEARLLGPGWVPLARPFFWPARARRSLKFCEMQIPFAEMKEPRSVRGSPTVRDHGGRRLLGPRTEFRAEQPGGRPTVRCIEYRSSGAIWSVR